MEKKELFRIMAAADGSMLRELAQPLAEKYGVSVVKAPAKTLAMIKLREPVKNSLFYLGEALVCDTVVELGGTKGTAVVLGDDFDKVISYIEKNPSLMNLQIINVSSTESGTHGFCVKDSNNNISVIYAGDYSYSNSWVDNFVGAVEEDSTEQDNALTFFNDCINKAGAIWSYRRCCCKRPFKRRKFGSVCNYSVWYG